jgi:hypothetical protein
MSCSGESCPKLRSGSPQTNARRSDLACTRGLAPSSKENPQRGIESREEADFGSVQHSNQHAPIQQAVLHLARSFRQEGT